MTISVDADATEDFSKYWADDTFPAALLTRSEIFKEEVQDRGAWAGHEGALLNDVLRIMLVWEFASHLRCGVNCCVQRLVTLLRPCTYRVTTLSSLW